MENSYLSSVRKQFEYYKTLADASMERLNFDELNISLGSEDNSIAIIAKHMAGNMLSRWTNFLTEDGEKSWRDRDSEFSANFQTKTELIDYWKKGWHSLFLALESIAEKDLEHIVYIRNQGHTVTEAINRQLAHYAYHVGQIVFIGKSILGDRWGSLSVPKGQSQTYNSEKFKKEKGRRHFTDDL